MSGVKNGRPVLGVVVTALLGASCASPVRPSASAGPPSLHPLTLKLPFRAQTMAGRLQVLTGDGRLLFEEATELPSGSTDIRLTGLDHEGVALVTWASAPDTTGPSGRPWAGLVRLMPASTASLVFDEMSTVAAAVWQAFWQKGGVPADQTPEKVRKIVEDLLEQVTDSHPRLLDASGVADDLVAGRTPAVSRAGRTGRVVFGMEGWPESAPAKIWADDLTSLPIDQLDAGLQDGRHVRWQGLSPGERELVLELPMGPGGTWTATTSVRIHPGEDSTASWKVPAWEPFVPLPEARGDAGATAHAGAVWAVAGYRQLPDGSLEATDTCWCLDTNRGGATWVDHGSLPFTSGRTLALTHDGRLYVLGEDGALASVALGSSPCTVAGAWRLESGRLETSGAPIAHFAALGRDLFALVSRPVESSANEPPFARAVRGYIWMRRQASDWTTALDLPVPQERSGVPGAAHHNGKILIAGGRTPGWYGPAGSVPSQRTVWAEELDLTTLARRPVDLLPRALEQGALAPSPLGWFLAGGLGDPDVTTRATWILPYEGASWHPMPPLGHARTRHAMVATDTRLLALGGLVGSGDVSWIGLSGRALATVESLNLEPWREGVKAPGSLKP
ncbi:MAG: kelch repeat-containing protein [Candidatus Sericytochromatia bacterium]|nr:kelch repeat-containing protein [Candidatus Sericytochromatia bacterium]